MKTVTFFIITFLSVCTIPSIFAQPEFLDTTFGDNGVVESTPANGLAHESVEMAIQQDGKIVAVGNEGGFSNTNFFSIVRYKTDGSFDPTFGTNGYVSASFQANDRANAIAIQDDGKIVVVGGSRNMPTFDGFTSWAIARYNVDGTLDGTFGNNGKIFGQFGLGFPSGGEAATDVVIQSDGKIVMCGNSGIVQLLQDGSINTSFGVGGNIHPGGTVMEQNLGNIYIAENTKIKSFQPNGTPNYIFGNNGVVDLNIPGATVTSMIVHGFGQATVGGYLSNDKAFLARCNIFGIDITFGDGGKKILDFGNDRSVVNAIAIQQDTFIVAGGYTSSSFGYDDRFALTRLRFYGSIDKKFGNDGLILTDFPGVFSFSDKKGYDLKIQDDDKIVMCGGNFLLSRYLASPTGSSTVPNPVAHFRLNGNAVEANNTNIVGAINGPQPAADRFGNPNGAYSFDGVNDFIEIPDNDILDADTADHTIVIWMKTSAQNQSGRLISKGSSFCDTGYMLRMGGSNGDKIHFENASDGSCFANFDGNGVVNDGQWHCIAGVVRRNTGGSIYIDGVLDRFRFSDFEDANFSNDLSFTVGKSHNASLPEYFSGTIDDIKLFNVALNEGQVQSACNGTITEIADVGQQEPGFKVYPNPANDVLWLDMSDIFQPGEYSYCIRNLLGELILTGNKVNAPRESLDVSVLTCGLYFVEISSKEKHAFRQFLKL